MNRSTLFLAGVALSVLATPAVAQISKPAPVADLIKRVDIPYEQFTLANGLRVVVHTDRKAPVVGVSVWYDIGSKQEPKGKTGFAHLFEHLMFNGSENSPGDFFEPLQIVGATDRNGTTDFDRTNYFETVPTPALDRALFLESDRMGYLLGAVTQAKLDNQRGVVQNEKRQGDNQPYGLVFYRLLDALFPNGHPYGHSPIGSMADLDAASLEDVKGWFRQNYGPNNAVLVLAGDVDLATARTLVEKHFGKIARGSAAISAQATVPSLAEPMSEEIKDRVATTRIYRAWAVPGMLDKEVAALQVGSQVLGGLASSRLDNALVRQEKVAVAVSSFLQENEQVGIFGITADVRPGVDAELVAKRLDAIIAEFLAKGPTTDEVQRVATQTVSGRISGLESVGGFGGKAVVLASGTLYANDPGFYKKQLAAYANTTPAAVKAAMQKWLSRPAYNLRVVPGAREGYVEAGAVAPKPATTATPAAPVVGTRGALPAVGDVGALDFPDVQRTKLANGIELVYAQRTVVPVTRAVISFDAGVAADRADKLGTQSLMLALLDEGTTTLDSTALAEAKERLGASIDAGASTDRTTVSMYALSPNLAPTLDLFADVVRNPAFAPAEVDRLRNQQLARISAELTNPGGLAQRTIPPLLYGPNSPYAKSAAGSGDPKAVAALTRADLVAFHQAWLRPDKAKIFVVSDRPLTEIKAAFETRFGSWATTGAAGTKTFATPVQSAPKIVLVDRPDSPQSLIIAAQLTGLTGKDDLLAHNTANDILGGNFLSRINTDLRETKGWSYDVRGGFNQLEFAAPYSIQAPVQADKTGASIVALREDIQAFLTDKGVTPAEYDRTISGSVRELSGNFETASDVLGAMQTNDIRKRPDNYYETIADKYRALTAAQLDSAARAVIDPDKLVWVVVGDAKIVRPQLDSLGLPVEVIAAPAPQPAARPAR